MSEKDTTSKTEFVELIDTLVDAHLAGLPVDAQKRLELVVQSREGIPALPSRASAIAKDEPVAIERHLPRPLADFLADPFDEPVFRILDRFEIEEDEARLLFRETKRWLWFMGTLAYERPDLLRDFVGVTRELRMLDEMWHEYILYTREYARAGDEFLGGFIHHDPTLRAEKELHQQEFSKSPEKWAMRFRQSLMIVREFLGEETLRRWYIEFPQRYTEAFVAERYFILWS